MIERDRKDNTSREFNVSYIVLDIIHGQLFKNVTAINEDTPERVFGMMRLLSIAPKNARLVNSPFEANSTNALDKTKKACLMRQGLMPMVISLISKSFEDDCIGETMDAMILFVLKVSQK